jgi:hypothetical protein
MPHRPSRDDALARTLFSVYDTTLDMDTLRFSLVGRNAAQQSRSALALTLLLALTATAVRSWGQTAATVPPRRGVPISPVFSTNSDSFQNTARPPLPATPEKIVDGVLQLSFDRLAAFKYEVYEYYSPTNSGRSLIRSDDVIPDWAKAYGGQQVSVSGYVLPLRMKAGKTTEFLLLKDRGTCCFGPQAQINHFMRVSLKTKDFDPDLQAAYKFTGKLHVGEMYIQGYLTGIYRLDDAEIAPDSTSRPNSN